MKTKVTKAIIPVAGFGTRFLPATKVQPKEMLPVVDKPVVHYLVEEAVEAGITQILFVINSSKHVIGDYFAKDLNLENFLKRRGKKDLLNKIRHIHDMAQFLYVHQDEPLGSGDAIMRGKSFVENEPFAVFYADDIMTYPKNKPAIGQLIKAYNKHGTSMMGLVKVPKEDISKYGVISGKRLGRGVYKVDGVVEKPKPKDAPSSLASVGRFVLAPEIFSCIKRVKKVGGEIYLASALAELAQNNRLNGIEIDGKWHDCGSKFGFWKANFELGLTHPELSRDVEEYLKKFKYAKK